MVGLGKCPASLATQLLDLLKSVSLKLGYRQPFILTYPFSRYWTGAEFCLIWYISLAHYRYIGVYLSCSNSISSVLLKCNFEGVTSRIFVSK